MNQRIRELMKEAQVIYDYAPYYGDMDRDPKPLYKLDPEKFAKLIVSECMDVVDPGENQLIARFQARQWLAEHFGE